MRAPRRRPLRTWQSRTPRNEALRKHDAACDRLIHAALKRIAEDRRVWERQQKEQQGMTELLALIALVGWGLALSLWWSRYVLTLAMREVKRNPTGLAKGAAFYNVMGRYQLREARA